MIIRNRDVRRVVIGIPGSHKHLRIAIFLNNNTVLVFHEATMANIVRAFVTVKTHPLVEAIELRNVKLEQRKKGFAEYPLLEVKRSAKDISEELLNIITRNTYDSGNR